MNGRIEGPATEGLARRLAARPPPGMLAVHWLGGAGFALQADDGQTVFVDAYLSDLCERLHGFRRLTPSPLRAAEARPDAWLATHHHADHLDVDAIAVLPRRTGVAFAAPPSCAPLLAAAGVGVAQVVPLVPGQRRRVGPVWVTAVEADHGDLAPDAVGVVIELGGVRVYHAGDTGFRPDYLSALRALQPEVTIVPINGRFGNLTPEEAARVAAETGAAVAVPCHFWLLAEHNGDPGAFVAACRALAPGVTPAVIPLGGRYLHPVQPAGGARPAGSASRLKGSAVRGPHAVNAGAAD